MKKRILFVINPISGIGKQKTVENLIPKLLDLNLYSPEIQYTTQAKHAIEISRKAANVFDVVVAIGGDGTVNEIAQGLIGSETIMAVIPTGSGNGFARYLKIPLEVEKAILTINSLNTKTIDTISINDKRFVNVAGVGFDAHIGHLFATSKTRGFRPYMELVLKEFYRYKAQTYELKIDEKTYQTHAFLISFANSTQFGFNAHIAPKAQINDGWIDVCVMRPFPLWASLLVSLRLFAKNIDKSAYTSMFLGKKITVSQQGNPMKGHIDGEPVFFGETAEIQINPLSLKVIVPQI